MSLSLAAIKSLSSFSSKLFPIICFTLFLNSLLLGFDKFEIFILIKSSDISFKNSSEYSKILSLFIVFFLWENITCLWSLRTLSNLIRVFLISKFLASTFCCALSNALFIHGWSMLSPSLRPSFSSILFIDSDPKILIKSSSRLT